MPSILFWNHPVARHRYTEKASLTHDRHVGRPSTSSSSSSSTNHRIMPADEQSLQQVLDQKDIRCDEDLLNLVLRVMNNDDTQTQDIQNLLWSLAKRLKDHDSEDPYRRAIRIACYYNRAKTRPTSAQKYYRKCLSPDLACTSIPVALELQNKALQNIQEPSSDHRPRSVARSASVCSSNSSNASSTASACSQCGIERRAMPVCARCRSQSYCSYKCLAAHKPVHQRDCPA
ncbi:hypothetical protein BCR43DRAFT_488621 [Syncephalastrum racemosum]|uniref:MYND-type domain-containing protein n=1 Tax=Syncephalastrum racemosum TaxID=13706 RepID=A0A1X2HIY2_SYNRA|nr:hypothetical protein BCR43DRAFT_488621 [Syncephalastrum racemosum]